MSWPPALLHVDAGMNYLSTIARRALHALLPAECTSCDAVLQDDPVPLFCSACWGSIRPLEGPFCPRCGRPFYSKLALRYSPYHLCSDCRKRKPFYTRAWALYAYEGPLRAAIRLFKYKGKVALCRAFGSLMEAVRPDTPPVDVIMPVPLHPARLREREFNQALLLADQVRKWVDAPVSYMNLVRTRATIPQTDLTQVERRRNLRRSFSVRRPARIAGRRILLVDDVMTTGTTLNECARTLRRAGSSDVYVVTLARTL